MAVHLGECRHPERGHHLHPPPCCVASARVAHMSPNTATHICLHTSSCLAFMSPRAGRLAGRRDTSRRCAGPLAGAPLSAHARRLLQRRHMPRVCSARGRIRVNAGGRRRNQLHEQHPGVLERRRRQRARAHHVLLLLARPQAARVRARVRTARAKSGGHARITSCSTGAPACCRGRGEGCALGGPSAETGVAMQGLAG